MVIAQDTYLHMTVMGLLPVDIWDLVIMSSISMRIPALGRPSWGHSVRWNWVTVKPSNCLVFAGYRGQRSKSAKVESQSSVSKHCYVATEHGQPHTQTMTYPLFLDGELANSEVIVGCDWEEGDIDLAMSNHLILFVRPVLCGWLLPSLLESTQHHHCLTLELPQHTPEVSHCVLERTLCRYVSITLLIALGGKCLTCVNMVCIITDGYHNRHDTALE